MLPSGAMRITENWISSSCRRGGGCVGDDGGGLGAVGLGVGLAIGAGPANSFGRSAISTVRSFPSSQFSLHFRLLSRAL